MHAYFCTASKLALLCTGNGLTLQYLVLCTWFYEHPYCTDSNILFLLLLTNVLWIKASAKGAKCKGKHMNIYTDVFYTFYYQFCYTLNGPTLPPTVEHRTRRCCQAAKVYIIFVPCCSCFHLFICFITTYSGILLLA